jgi:hypothetical protein
MESPLATEETQTAQRGSKKRRSLKQKIVSTILREFERSAKKGGVKVTAGDALRALEWDEETVEAAEEIKVTWVEPKEESSNEP